MLINVLGIISALIFLNGCTQKEVVRSGERVWHISSKAQINDKTKDSSNNVTIDIFLKEQQAFRLEVTATLGYQVGSLLMTKNYIKYAIHPNKYFIQGPAEARTIKPLFKQEIDPRILWSVIHDQDLSMHGFKCSRKEASVQVCKNNLGLVEVEQRGDLDEQGQSKDHQKKVTIENNNIKMIWIFKSQEILQEYQNETFVLNSPKEYKLITIK